MIISEKTTIKLSGKNLKYYRDLGYICKKGEEIIVNVKDLTIWSTAFVEIKCDICGIIKTMEYGIYNQNIKRYGYYSCNGKCSKEKLKITFKEKYGTEWYWQTEECKKKTKNTNLEKYGDENYRDVDQIKQTKKDRYGDENYNNRESSKKTMIELYGVEYPQQSKKIKEKTKQTNLENFGYESNLKNPEVQNQIKETNIKTYGVIYPSKLKIIQDKQKKTNLEKYGVECVLNNKEIKDKANQTNIELYGTKYPIQTLEIHEKQQKSGFKIKNHPMLNINYRGTYEKNFLDLCVVKNIQIERGITIKYFFNEIDRVYFSDFYYKPLNLIIEIKSNYTFKKDLEKNLAKQKACTELGYKFIFIIDKNYDEFLRIIKSNSKIN